MSTITSNDVQAMVTHWLKTPAEGYLGSSYGQELKSFVQNPQTEGNAEAVISKLKRDLPLLNSLPSGAISLYGVSQGVDGLIIVLQVSGLEFNVTDILNNAN